jgi:hypothetical protein
LREPRRIRKPQQHVEPVVEELWSAEIREVTSVLSDERLDLDDVAVHATNEGPWISIELRVECLAQSEPDVCVPLGLKREAMSAERMPVCLDTTTNVLGEKANRIPEL